MTRRCKRCLQLRPLRDFDLGSERSSARCLTCARLFPREGTGSTGVQVTSLEGRRGVLIKELIQLDAKIALLRSQDSPKLKPLLTTLKQRRQSQIAALVKIDAELADLRPSTPPPRLIVDEVPVVEPSFDDDTYDDDRVSEI